MPTQKKILQSGFLVFILVLCAKILALVKDMILAYLFGQGEITDAYFITFQIPHTMMYVFGITILKGMSSSIFSEIIAKKRYNDLSVLFSTIFNTAFLATAIISTICIWKMPDIIRFLPHSFQDATFDVTVLMGRVLFTMLLTLGLSDFLGAVLNAYRNFFLPGLSLITANLCMILSLIFFADRWGILSLAYGTAFGFSLALSIQFIFIIRTKIRYNIGTFGLNFPPVISFLKKSMPLLLVTSLGQISILLSYIIALNIEEGMASALSYATKINEFSLSLFVLPLLTVLLPEFARDKAANKMNDLKSHIRFGSEVISAILVFWVAFMLVNHREVITVLFERGEFTVANTDITSDILLIYLIGLLFHAGHLLFVFIFYGLQKTKALVIIGVISYSINIILLFLLSQIYGVYGIAWSAVISSMIYFVLLFTTFKIFYIKFSLIKQGRKLMKIVLVGIVMVIIFYVSQKLLISESAFFQIVLSGTAGLIIYLSMLHFFRIFSFDSVIIGIKRYVKEQN